MKTSNTKVSSVELAALEIIASAFYGKETLAALRAWAEAWGTELKGAMGHNDEQDRGWHEAAKEVRGILNKTPAPAAQVEKDVLVLLHELMHKIHAEITRNIKHPLKDEHQPLEENVVPLVHAPIRPARKDGLGEQVYQRRWAELANSGKLDEALFESRSHDRAQRMASVSASFITWLGTNIGNCFVEKSLELYAHARDDAFTMAWSVENKRTPWLNHGIRTLEYILAEDNSLGNSNLMHANDAAMPSVTLADYETVDRLCTYLGSNRGLEFVKTCEQEIAEGHRAARQAARQKSL